MLIKAIMACCDGNFNQAIKLNDIKGKLEHNLDVKSTTQQIHAMVASLDFNVRFYQGYDHLAANNDLLATLANQRDIRWEEDRGVEN